MKTRRATPTWKQHFFLFESYADSLLKKAMRVIVVGKELIDFQLESMGWMSLSRSTSSIVLQIYPFRSTYRCLASIIAYRSPRFALRCSLFKRLRKEVCKTILFTRMRQAWLLDLNHKPVEDGHMIWYSCSSSYCRFEINLNVRSTQVPQPQFHQHIHSSHYLHSRNSF